jgi:two-component system, NarL family, response regulator LiaR
MSSAPADSSARTMTDPQPRRHPTGVAAARVVLVDDQRMMADAVAARMEMSPGMEVDARFGFDEVSLVRELPKLCPEVIVVVAETVSPTISTLVGQINEAWPAGQILLLAADGEPALAVAAVRAGANSWVSATSSFDNLLEVIHGVRRGEAFFPAAYLGPVLRALRDDLARARQHSEMLGALSSRERQVLQGIVEGMRDGRIAAELCISPYTVRTHVANILAKLKVHSRLEAATVARAAGMDVGPVTAIHEGAAGRPTLVRMM